MLKTPKSKDVIGNAVTAGSLVVGAMASDAVVAFVPAKDKTIGKAAITGGSLIGAAVIKGTSKTAKIFQLVLIGMGVMQGVALLRENLGASLKQEGTGHVAKAVNGALGLGCPCDGGLGNPYPALMYANTVESVDWDREFIPQQEYAEFEDVPNMM